MSPEERGKRVAKTVEADILPRLARWDSPVDLAALAEAVAQEIEAALRESKSSSLSDLFREEP